MSSTNNSNTNINNSESLVLGGAEISDMLRKCRMPTKTKKKNKSNDENNSNRSLVLAEAKIHDMLRKCRLAYLSTIDMVNTSSHLSLMRFTYLYDMDDGEVVIMSTNKKTKKFENLQQQKGVSLLVHDFGQGAGNDDGVYSITLNGECRIVSDTQKAEDYREAHLANNPDYPQFIVGKDIAILCVGVKSARICDISDTVTTWAQ
jgi:general stress protein 26